MAPRDEALPSPLSFVSHASPSSSEDDASAGALAGTNESTVLIVNSARDRESFAGRAVVADFTTLALEVTDVLPSLSTALGVAAARVLGLSANDCLAGVRAELGASLGPEIVELNLRLAERVFSLGESWPRLDLSKLSDISTPATSIVDMRLDPPRRAAPSIYASANTPERRTGNWRQNRPELEREKCNRCWLCFVWCPEAAIALDDEDYPVVDYDVCKGCLLCAHECPTHAFRVEREVRA
jgi:pyruvate ferredoxin oxidoreductase gamma subunit